MNVKKLVGSLVSVVVLLVFCVAPLSAAEVAVKPSDTHYVFAHRALPSLLFTKKEALLRAFENRGQSFVEDLWAAVQKTTSENGTAPRDKEGLVYSKERVENATVHLVKLPRPSGLAEAFFTAVIEKDGKAKYFTLELTTERAGCPFQTILGEWQENGQHSNYGCGPKVDKQEFIKEIIARF